MPNKIIDVILSGAKYLVSGTTTVFNLRPGSKNPVSG